MAPVEGISPDLVWSTGPAILGLCFNWCFFGILLVQIYFYHLTFPEDSTKIKALVYILLLLDVLQTIMITADAFHWFVFGFGDPEMLNDTFLNSWDVPFLDAIIALIVQAFYCWRIHGLRQSYLLPIVILLVSLAQCGAGIAVAVHDNELGKLLLIGESLIPESVWLAGSVVSDIMIAATLTWTLLASDPFLPSSRRTIRRIVLLTVETNTLTAGMATLSLIIFLAVPKHPSLVVPPTAIMGKLYTNCLVATLNNRHLMQKSPDQTSGGVHTSRSTTSGLSLQAQFPSALKIYVRQNTETDFDVPTELRDVRVKSDRYRLPRDDPSYD